MWQLYKAQPSFVLGFHGCDEAVGEDVLRGRTGLTQSNNEYDWLGTGIYFWEGNPQRALEFAEAATRRPQLTKGRIEKPFVVGAVIDLGLCCNLFDSQALEELKKAHTLLKLLHSGRFGKMPENKGEDLGARFLDRAVIELMHVLRSMSEPPLPSYDTVRAGFQEGGLLYENAGFSAKSHIQIAVRNKACIKGYFRPIAHG